MRGLFCTLSFCLMSALPAHAWLFSRAAPDPNSVSLADYIKMSKEARGEFLESALPLVSADASEHVEKFRNCLGHNAPIKRADITALTVLGWCNGERANDPDRFNNHFNDLEAANHSSSAVVICRNLVRSELVAPSTADFSFLDRNERALGSWRYEIAGKLEAKNAVGVPISLQFWCDLQYNGEGDELAASSWTLNNFNVLPAR
jgi:hypothetical protein